MRIGTLSTRTSVPAKTIRYYEEIGVLPPAERSPNGYRAYGTDAIERLDFIKDAQATGLTLDEIATVLRLRGKGESTCEHVVHLLDHHLAHLDARIEALHATRTRLVDIIERAKTLDPAECNDPNRCQTISPRHEGSPAVAHEPHGAPGAHPHL
ncbi:MAG: MerR family DNA-binding protein [Actinobacteria bacterium]|nr:MerR family DNA-binding protein [Actinomycetota bacterium]MBU1493889.1 MerR family DNA-binding protein [Actinomycetota bacterium]MBU1865363.1 MerR family DNA-binding protein [Actinomycetota bacterium]